MSKKDKEVAQTGVANTSESGFAIVDQPEAKQMMLSAFDELGITESLLTRIKMPTGGMTAFMVDELEGQQVYQHIDVILVAIKGRQKAWWSTSLDDSGGGARPSCSSSDGIHGEGNNTMNPDEPDGTHLCKECPWEKYGSSRFGGEGKDCKDFNVLFFFREGSRLPSVMSVPATSLRSVQDYVMKLIDNGKRYASVVTRIGLKPAVSKGGITYSMIDINFQRDLEPSDAAGMVSVGKDLMSRISEFDNFSESETS